MRVPAAIGFVALTACAPVAIGAEDEAIIGGTPSTEPAAVAIGTVPPACGAPVEVVCTGTVVAPRLVIGAAHCFAGAAPGITYAVVVGADATAPDAERHHVAEITLHPAFDASTNAADLAALVVDPPITVTPMPIARTPIDASITGTTVDAIGYGAAASTGAPTGMREHGTLSVSALEGADRLRLDPDPAMSCHGDSGGPIVLAGQLLAVTAAGDPGCATYGIAVRLDAHLSDFVDPAIASAAAWTPPTPRVPAARLCDVACASDHDCPLGLTCAPSSSGSRCTVSGAGVGNLGAACTATASGCGPGDSCAATSDGCHCFSPCASGPPPPPPMGGSGCDAMPAAPRTSTQIIFCAIGVAVLNILARKRRII